MKLYDIITSAFKEIKLGYKLLIPAFITTSVMIAVAIILLNISSSTMDVIYAQFTDSFKDGLDISIENADFDDIDTLKELGLSDISIYSMSSTIYSTVFKDSENNDIEYSVVDKWVGGNENNINDTMKKLGISTDFDNTNDAYIVCAAEDCEYLKEQKTLTAFDTKGNELCSFSVKNVIVNDEETGYGIYVPLTKLYEEYTEQGIYPTVSVQSVIKYIPNYASIRQTLSDNGFKVSSSIDDLSENTAMLEMFFKAMSVIIIVLGILSLVTMCNMYFKSRNRHIILQKILGMTSKGVFSILFVIIEILLIISSLAAMIIVFWGNNYIYGVLAEVFGEFDYSVSNTLTATLTAFVIANISALVSSIGIYRKIKRTDIVSVFGNNE